MKSSTAHRAYLFLIPVLVVLAPRVEPLVASISSVRLLAFPRASRARRNRDALTTRPSPSPRRGP